MISSKLLSQVAIAFVEGDHFNEQVDAALKVIGTCLQLSRVYILLDGADHFGEVHAYEWHAEAASSVRESLGTLPFGTYLSVKQMLQERERIFVTDLAVLPHDVQSWFGSHGIQSLLVYPIVMNRRIAGLVAFEDCIKVHSWTAEEVDMLGTVSEIISAFCERKIRSEQDKVAEDNFRRLFHIIDDLIVIADLNGKILFANPAVELKLGFSSAELRDMTIMDLSPCDQPGESINALGELLRQEIMSCPLFFCHKSGQRLMVESRVLFGQWNARDCIFLISKDISKEQEALQKFTRIFETNPALIAIIGFDDDRLTDVNAAFLEKLGYVREQVIGKTSSDLGLFLDDARRSMMTSDIKKAGVIKNVEKKVRHRDGFVIDGLFSGTIFESLGKKYWLIFIVDISDHVALRDNLESQSKRLRNTIDGARMGTWEWNIHTDEVILNEWLAEILGYTLAELGPMKMTSLKNRLYPEDLQKSDRMIEQHFVGEVARYDLEYRIQHKNQQWVWVHVRGMVIEWSAEGKPLMMFGTMSDISERKALEERILEISIRDSLTGIYNRRYVFERLEEIFAEYIRRNRNFSIAIMDIDHFKRVNDTFGHQAGDFILKQFADIVNASIRTYDILGRYGGEEFILVSVNTMPHETIALIERIMNVIRERVFVYHGREICFRFSCGMADTSEFPHGTLSIEKMVELADQRLYVAKETGRDRLIGSATCK